jgi:tetratricopeptide (TPR) repeat protein
LLLHRTGERGRGGRNSRDTTRKSPLTTKRPVAEEQLGDVSFETSCSAAVESSFNRAVALLHSFQYQDAEEGFKAVAQRDPQCAIAYWGVAMSLYHPLWESPGQDTLKQGLKAVEKGESASAKTDREKEYIAAIGTFYRGSDKMDHDARAAAYAKAMAQLYERYPRDREAAAFYALSLLGEEPPKDDRLANRKKAAAILEGLFKEVPNHPGVAHYLIHAYDTPELAQLGLPAARSYAKIAPSSSHALHMPSHIFSRLGLWQDSIDSNLAAIKAAETPEAARRDGESYAMHAMDFLEYAYLQSGREEAARRVIEEVKTVPGADASNVTNTQADFGVRYEIELHHWSKAASLVAPSSSHIGLKAYVGWARVIGAARSDDAAAARKDLADLEALDAVKHDYPAAYADREHQEAAAWAAFAEGKRDEAVRMMRAAADSEDAAGPEQLTVPARELLGDMLLEMRQPAEAAAAYETSLEKAPNRFDSLYGAARASDLAGNEAKASDYYSRLLKNCDASAHCDRPEMAEIKALLARR